MRTPVTAKPVHWMISKTEEHIVLTVDLPHDETCSKVMLCGPDASLLHNFVVLPVTVPNGMVVTNMELEQQQQLARSNKTLAARIRHNGVGGTMTMVLQFQKVLPSSPHYEFRYQSETKTGVLKEYLQCHWPFGPSTTKVSIYDSDTLPTTTHNSVRPTYATVNGANLDLGNLTISTPDNSNALLPTVQHDHVTLHDGTNVLLVRATTFDQMHLEASPQEHVRVDTISQWTANRPLCMPTLHVYRDDSFVHSMERVQCQPGELLSVRCGTEPDMVVQLNTTTTDLEVEAPKTSQRVTHKVTVLSPTPDTVQVKLMLPSVSFWNPNQIEVVPELQNNNGQKVSQSVAILPVQTTTSSTEESERREDCFSYTIAWQQQQGEGTAQSDSNSSSGFAMGSSTNGTATSGFDRNTGNRRNLFGAPSPTITTPPFGTLLNETAPTFGPRPEGSFGLGQGTKPSVTFGSGCPLRKDAFGSAPTSLFASPPSGPPYRATSADNGGTNIKVHSICAMNAYQAYSPEELRWKDLSCKPPTGSPQSLFGNAKQSTEAPPSSILSQTQSNAASLFGARAWNAPCAASLFQAAHPASVAKKEVDKTALETKHIELFMSQTGCSRAEAVKAFKAKASRQKHR